jgi:hypothetical protein
MHHHTFPADLVQAQRDWYATYRELAASGGSGTHTTVLRRRLVRLSVRITAHPFWATLPGSAPAARMELKEMAWADAPAPEPARGPAPAPAPAPEGEAEAEATSQGTGRATEAEPVSEPAPSGKGPSTTG